MTDDHKSREPKAEEKAQPTRRPYERPKVESSPLFERMALNCDQGLKGSGEDDRS